MANVLELWAMSPEPTQASYDLEKSTLASKEVREVGFGQENIDNQVLIIASNEVSADSSLLKECIEGMKAGTQPELTSDGTGGTYWLQDVDHEFIAVFKPRDEEPYAPENPRGFIGPLGSTALRKGVYSGEGYQREAAAYLLDHGHFSRVPETQVATVTLDGKPKIGSLQRFEHNDGFAEDFGPSYFPKSEAERLAILDIRILNMDRNSCNTLVRHGSHGVELLPIDHGLSLPDMLGIAEYHIMWMAWGLLKEPPTPELIEYAEKIDINKDADLLRDQLGIWEQNITNFKIINFVLKNCIARGLSIYQVGKIIYRPGYGEEKSILEDIVKKAKTMYEDVHGSLVYCRVDVDNFELDSPDSLPSTVDSYVSEDEICQWDADEDLDECFYQYLDAFLEQEISKQLKNGFNCGRLRTVSLPVIC